MRNKYKGKDVTDRLNNTVIRYKGHPYLCTVDSQVLMLLHDITNGNLCHKVNYDDEDLDISSINIGYINIAEPDYRCAVYLKRQPLRRYKQGLEIGNLTQKVLRSDMSGGINPSRLSCRGFVDAVLGHYPTLSQALTFITKNAWTSVALSRDVALKREGELLKIYLKDDEVGYMRLGTTQVIIPKTELSWYHVFLLENIVGWTVKEG